MVLPGSHALRTASPFLLRLAQIRSAIHRLEQSIQLWRPITGELY